MKELPYFRFTASEWLTDDISFEPYQVKGIFIDACSFYWMRDCVVTKEVLEKRFSNARDLLEVCYSIEIIKLKQDNFVEITFLDKQYDLLSEKRKKRQKSGKKGGLRKSSNAKAMLKQKPSYKDKDKDKDRGKFQKPSLQEIRDYIIEKSYSVDASAFYSFYESKGWMVGKNKMKSWTASLALWNSRNNQGKPKPTGIVDTPEDIARFQKEHREQML